MANHKGGYGLLCFLFGSWGFYYTATSVCLIGVVMGEALFGRAEWDDEASVWVATSDDIPVLVAEADTADAVIQVAHVDSRVAGG